MIDIFKQLSKDMIVGPEVSPGQNLIYLADIGIGYLKDCSTENIYDKDYFAKYIAMSKSRMGILLNSIRVSYTLSSTNASKSVCDIGIGSGEFINQYDCKGSDINPIAIEYLKIHNRYADLSKEEFEYLTFWDSLEHITDPTFLLSKATKGVVLSMPIYTGFDNILQSKHYRPNEHIWYFTDSGLKTFMNHFGFKYVSSHIEETLAGRDSIGSYFFVK